MEKSEILDIANEIVGVHGLRASFLGNADVRSVGVGGDNRTYTRVVVLEGLYPGDKVLADIATKICNRTAINRVTFDITPPRDEKPPKH